MYKFSTLIFILCLIASCQTTRTSTLVSDSYDQTKNQTTLMIFPFGNVVMPGKWTKYNYNETSRQHYFINADSIAISVTKNPITSYPFYSKELSTLELTREWYKWESDFFSEQGIEILEINSKSEDEFIIWQAKATNVNNMFLYGIKDKIAYNLSVVRGNWSNEERISFLTSLWNTN
jgi:hypothetical protein